MEIGNPDIQQKICEHIDDPQTFFNFARSNKRNAKHAMMFGPSKKIKFSKNDEYNHQFTGGTLIPNGYRYTHVYKMLPHGHKHGQETVWFTNTPNVDGGEVSLKYVVRNWDTGILHGPTKIFMVLPPYSPTGMPYLFADLNYCNGKLHGDQRIYHNWVEDPDHPGISRCQIATVTMNNGAIDLENRDFSIWQVLNKIARSASIQPFEQQHIRVWRNCDACRCHIYPDMEYYHCWDPECADYDHCLNCEMAGFTALNHHRGHQMRLMNEMLGIDDLERNQN